MVEYNVIVLAAGQGKRMNAGKNKQFIELLDEPLIIHTLKRFIQDSWCQHIYLVINPTEHQQMQQLLANYLWNNQVTLVEGGKERQESGYKGLLAVKSEEQERIIMIHDGARPFVNEEHLHALAQAATQKKAALLAVPVTDTIKRKNGDNVETVDRSTLWAAQTPQAFQYDLIKKAHENAISANFLGTDDVSLVEVLNEPVEIVEGTYHNVKLTTPEDIMRAEMILNRQEEK
ncbi:2-C-methyl-D-erythritol 4-phosphate cytidylyltransferase [Gracilibacillus kekensis]|uniref:2-C-methyl-D-erythritol 4-phosphate cytidylyltransferase n=1 Tax=Gracilibacillus kekensis TaxID=1027249 RepID=A0A1M7QYD1_9BACI|nr:2-C-methyl-D-erythritol 4-phosphate cytidylyltransferase [Gracilibacillus kekensis]SHN37118.1 2-C-methyl-D-erythritol 4-phosphate cytidylyltransferase/2-C-methyl-D-erythritol 4-phosphate cytidylyltransferase / 2-C-methyl-D-erythritol 2,4-cyclodiphosphate synthase [Gracilibacillus kekensis]